MFLAIGCSSVATGGGGGVHQRCNGSRVGKSGVGRSNSEVGVGAKVGWGEQQCGGGWEQQRAGGSTLGGGGGVVNVNL